jgi:ABC-type branched-subunit amino acid transport system substrate-binding protein
VLLVSLLFLNIAANKASASPHQNSKQKYNILGLYGLTGPLPEFSAETRNGAILFQERIGKENEVLNISFDDHRFDVKIAVSAYQRARLNNIQAIHILGSGPSLAIKPLAREDGVLLFSYSAHPDILKGYRRAFRHGSLTSFDASDLIRDLRKLETPQRLALLSVENEWANSFTDAFVQSLSKQDASARLVSEQFLPTETDFRGRLTKVLQSKPEAVVVNFLGNTLGLIVLQLRQLGYTGPIYANVGLTFSPDAQKMLREAKIKNLWYQSYPDVGKEFSTIYENRFQRKPGYPALVGYTDFEFLHAAVEQVGLRSKEVAEYMRQVGSFPGRFLTLHVDKTGGILDHTQLVPFLAETSSAR